MRTPLKSWAGLAALAGALCAPAAWAAGPKTSGTSVIVDDWAGGPGGTVRATAGTSELDGAVGQLATILSGPLAPGATVEAGYFSALVSSPTTPAVAQINASSFTVAWSEAVPPNPTGTVYTVDASTDPGFGGVLISSGAFGLSGVVPGLKGNTTYYSRISAGYAEGDDSFPMTLGQTVTKAQPPAGGLISDVAPFTLKAEWEIGRAHV